MPEEPEQSPEDGSAQLQQQLLSGEQPAERQIPQPVILTGG